MQYCCQPWFWGLQIPCWFPASITCIYHLKYRQYCCELLAWWFRSSSQNSYTESQTRVMMTQGVQHFHGDRHPYLFMPWSKFVFVFFLVQSFRAIGGECTIKSKKKNPHQPIKGQIMTILYSSILPCISQPLLIDITVEKLQRNSLQFRKGLPPCSLERDLNLNLPFSNWHFGPGLFDP